MKPGIGSFLFILMSFLAFTPVYGEIEISISFEPVRCYGESSGIIKISVTGGTPDYFYSYSGHNGSGTFETSSDYHEFTGVASGNYGITVFDANDLYAGGSIVVTQPFELTVAISPDPAEACRDADLFLNGDPSGGNDDQPYIHEWSGPDVGNLDLTTVVDPVFNSGVVGSYALTYTVTDHKGCDATQDITVTVAEFSDGGTLSGNTDPVCEGVGIGPLSLAGQVGDIVRWEKRVDSGPWQPIAHTLDTYSEIPASHGTWDYRAVVMSGGCPEAYSNILSIVVNPLPTLTGAGQDAAVCEGSPAIINLSGLLPGTTSTIDYTINGVAQAPVTVVADGSGNASFSTPSLTLANDGQTLRITQVTITSATPNCSETFTQDVILSVDPATVGGTVSSAQTICYNTQPADLTITGHTGSIVKWQRSTDAVFTTPVDIGVTDATLTGAQIGNLTTDTWFRAVIQSGVCAEVASNHTVVTVDPATEGGNVTGGSTICEGSTSEELTLADHVGAIQRWEYSTDDGVSWTTIVHTGTTYTSEALTQTTWFRAVVQSGVCAEVASGHTEVTVSPTTEGGDVTGGTIICEGSTSGLLTLTNHVGSLVRWESSTDDGVSWTTIVHAGTTYTSGPLTQTTWFRAVVKSGVCVEEVSIHTVVTVDPATVGGNVTGGTTICEGSTSGLLALSGHTGAVQRWESSTNSGGSWTPIVHTGITYTSGVLTQTTWFRAVVQSGVCAEVESDYTVVSVDPATVGGNVTGGSAICQGFPSDELTLSGHTGSVVRWESSTDDGVSWNHITHTGTTYTSNALTQTTWFRAVVQSGVCAEVASTHTVVSVDPTAESGNVTGGTTVCEGSASGLLTLSGHVGDVVRWESSIDGGFAWTTIAHIGTTYTSGILTETTWFRAVVESGVCGEAASTHAEVIVSPATVGGNVTGGSTVCEGSTSEELELSAHTGTVQRWESSTDDGISWTTIVHSGTTYTSGALTQTTWFRAVVQSGVCAEVASTHTEVIVSPATVGGDVTGGTTICEGSASELLTLSGHTGAVQRWESSTDGGISWTTIVHSGTTYTSGALTQTTWFRAVVQSGVCAEVASSHTVVTVDPATEGGNVTGGSTICEGSTSEELTLADHVGAIQRWESSTDDGVSWTTIVHAGTTFTSGALTETTWFRAVVQSGVCAEVASGHTEVTVSPTTEGGDVTGGTIICEGSTSGLLTLTNHVGSLVRWESSTDDGVSWTTIVHAGTTYTSEALTETTWFRAVVQSGVCAEEASAYAEVIVSPPTVGGNVTGGSTICEGSSSEELALSGHTGAVQRWESSTDDGVSWTTIVHAGITYTSGALTQTTWFRAVVQSGACAEVASTHTEVIVSPATDGGEVTGIATPLCLGETTGIMTLANYTGEILRWQKRLDGLSWTDIDNTTNTYEEVPDAAGTWEYRAEVRSGVCGPEFSAALTIIVNPLPEPVISGNNNICGGSVETYSTALVAGNSYEWQVTGSLIFSGENTNEVTVEWSADGSLTLTETIDATGCKVTTDPFNVVVSAEAPSAIPVITGDNEVCRNQMLILTVDPPVEHAFDYEWTLPGGAKEVTDVNLTFDFDGLPLGDYDFSVIARNACGVSGSSAVHTVKVNPIPSADGTVNNAPVICNDGNTDIVLFSDVPGTNFEWTVSWLPADATWEGGKTPMDGTRNNGVGYTISQQLLHGHTGQVVVSYAITPYDPGETACPGNTIIVDVTVEPRLLLTSDVEVTTCSDQMFSYTPASGPGTSFGWNRPEVAGISNEAAAGVDDINEVLFNTTPDPVEVIYIYTLTTAECSGTDSVVVTVLPAPVLSSGTSPDAICSETAFNYVPGSETAGTTFAWSRAGVAGISNAAASGDDVIDEVLINTTTDPVDVVYEYVMTANGCTNTQNVVVTVNPVPVLSSTLTPPAISNGAVFSYDPASETAGTTFTWSRAETPGISNPAATGADNPEEALHNTTAGSVDVVYEYTLIANGCINTQNVVVTVNPSSSLTSTLTPDDVCSGTPFSYTPESDTDGTTFDWSRPEIPGIENAAATGVDEINEILINTTPDPVAVTYEYTLTAFGTVETEYVVVTVNPVPQLSSTLNPDPLCTGSAFIYTPESETAGTVFAWSRVVVDGISNEAATGDGGINEILNNTTESPVDVVYEYTLEANGCINTGEVTASVGPVFVRNPIDGEDLLCEGTPNRVYDVVPRENSTYSWSYEGVGVKTYGGEIDDNFVVFFFPDPGEHVVRLTETDQYGCVGEAEVFEVLVAANPYSEPVVGLDNVCEGSTGIYNVTLTDGSNYQWSVPAGSSVISGADGPDNNQVEVLFGSESGNVRVRETNQFGCTGFWNSLMVDVDPLPESFDITGGGSYCESDDGVSVGLSGSQIGVNYELFVNDVTTGITLAGDGDILDFGLQTATGVYTVLAVSTTGDLNCSHEMNGSADVSIYDAPVIELLSSETDICAGEDVSFIASGASVYEFFVNGESRQGPGPGNTFVASGIEEGDIIIANGVDNNGCAGVSNPVSLLVKPLPPSFVSLPELAGICHGEPVELYISAEGGFLPYIFTLYNEAGDVVEERLSLGDITFTGIETGIYRVGLDDYNGCGPVMSGDIDVMMYDEILFADVIVTDAIVGVTGDNGSILIEMENAGSYQYSIDGGIIWQAGNLFENLAAGNYDILVMDVNGCTADTTVVVGEIVTIAAVIDTTDPLCHNSADGVIIIEAEFGAEPYEYSIDGGASFYSPNTFTGLTAGIYDVVVMDSNGHTFTETVVLNDPDIMEAAVSVVPAWCSSNSPDGAADLTVTGGTGQFRYLWSTGVQTGDLKDILPGAYNVVVTDENNCEVTLEFEVGYEHLMEVTLPEQIDICYGESIVLGPSVERSGSSAVYSWSASSGSDPEPLANPTVTPLTPTFYTVRVTDENSCYDEAGVTVAHHPLQGIFIGNDTIVAQGESITLEATGGDFVSYEWAPGTGLSDLSGPVTTAIITNPVTYFVFAETAEGCIESDSIFINVVQPVQPASGFTPNNDGVNDYFDIPNAEGYPNIVVEVFNRSGQRVYHSRGYSEDNRWDGTINGRELPTGTYYFVITLNDNLGTKPVTGPVTIVR